MDTEIKNIVMYNHSKKREIRCNSNKMCSIVYTENHITLMKEIKKDINKWRDPLYLCYWKYQHNKYVSSPQTDMQV